MSRRTTLAVSSLLLAGTALCGAGAGAAAARPAGHSAVTHRQPVSSCSSLTAAQAARVAETRVPTVFGRAWTTLPGSNHYDRCAALSWIDLSITGATGSSPHQIALFHGGRYLGTATKDAYGFTPTINRLGDAAIRVVYHWPHAGETTAGATGTTVAGFSWNGAQHRVTMTGHVPPQQ